AKATNPPLLAKKVPRDKHSASISAAAAAARGLGMTPSRPTDTGARSDSSAPVQHPPQEEDDLGDLACTPQDGKQAGSAEPLTSPRGFEVHDGTRTSFRQNKKNKGEESASAGGECAGQAAEEQPGEEG
ncbi:unnamed protein product, partial [Sphacelaria rigidula]